MRTLWKKNQTLHPAFDKLNRSLEDDWFLLPFELKLQEAHAKTLQAAGILSSEECADIIRALGQIDTERTGKPCPRSDVEDIHTWIETTLVEKAGDAGKKIHTARSRNDQVATLLKMFVFSAGKQLSRELSALTAVFARQAKNWSDLVFPLQTHCQFAAPGSVGFWSLRYGTSFDRCRQRARLLLSQWQQYCPLGSGAVAGSSIPIDRKIQAKELGFEEPCLSALDVTSSRDECLDFLSLAVQIALHLQSFATDVIAFSQTQLSWTEYPKAFGTGSSMMPNKTNPDAMELLRGECNGIIAAQNQAITLLKGLPSGYNRDLQCIKPLVRDTADKLSLLISMTVDFVEQLSFNQAKIAESLKYGAIDATLRMEDKVTQGTPVRDAHHAIADDLNPAIHNDEINPFLKIDRYKTFGSASPAETIRIADWLLTGLEQ